MDNLRTRLNRLAGSRNREELSVNAEELTVYCKGILKQKIMNLYLSSGQMDSACVLLKYWRPSFEIAVSEKIQSGDFRVSGFKVEVDIENAIEQISVSITEFVDKIKSIALNGDRIRTSPSQILEELHRFVSDVRRQDVSAEMSRKLENILEEHFGVKAVEYEEGGRYCDCFLVFQANSMEEPVTTVPALIDIYSDRCVISGKYVVPKTD